MKLLVTDYVSPPQNQTPPTSGGRRKFLTCHATKVLTDWYLDHRSYPYPCEEQVSELAGSAHISVSQVKKWMANKRVRNSNTLAISGSIHPKKLHKMLQLKEARENPEAAARRQMNKTPRRFLNPRSVAKLSEWYNVNKHYPYPTDDQKYKLANDCGLQVAQVSCWFANKRNRSNNTRSHQKLSRGRRENEAEGTQESESNDTDDTLDSDDSDELIDVLDTSDTETVDIYT